MRLESTTDIPRVYPDTVGVEDLERGKVYQNITTRGPGCLYYVAGHPTEGKTVLVCLETGYLHFIEDWPSFKTFVPVECKLVLEGVHV